MNTKNKADVYFNAHKEQILPYQKRGNGFFPDSFFPGRLLPKPVFLYLSIFFHNMYCFQSDQDEKILKIDIGRQKELAPFISENILYLKALDNQDTAGLIRNAIEPIAPITNKNLFDELLINSSWFKKITASIFIHTCKRFKKSSNNLFNCYLETTTISTALDKVDACYLQFLYFDSIIEKMDEFRSIAPIMHHLIEFYDEALQKFRLLRCYQSLQFHIHCYEKCIDKLKGLSVKSEIKESHNKLNEYLNAILSDINKLKSIKSQLENILSGPEIEIKKTIDRLSNTSTTKQLSKIGLENFKQVLQPFFNYIYREIVSIKKSEKFIETQTAFDKELQRIKRHYLNPKPPKFKSCHNMLAKKEITLEEYYGLIQLTLKINCNGSAMGYFVTDLLEVFFSIKFSDLL